MVRAETNPFTVEAQRFMRIGLIVERPSYERNTDGRTTRVDVRINSVPGSIIIANGDGAADQQMDENTVKAGESWWGIAARTYGDGTLWKALKAANNNPRMIHPGTVITLPAKGDLKA